MHSEDSLSSNGSVVKHIQSLHRLSNTYLRGRVHSCHVEKENILDNTLGKRRKKVGPRGLPTRELWVKYEILNILGIDTVGQSFRTRCILEATWREKHLSLVKFSATILVKLKRDVHRNAGRCRLLIVL